MNVVEMPKEDVIRIANDIAQFKIDASYLTHKYCDLSKTVFPSFKLLADHCVFAMTYEFVEKSDLPAGYMEDYQGSGKVIKWTNSFDKRDPKQNIYKESKEQGYIDLNSFVTTELYLHPQEVIKDGILCADLYAEPTDDCYNFSRFTEAQKLGRCLSALAFLDYVETRLKKEKHLIKRLMPTPEQIEQANKAKRSYESAPVIIKGLSVRYIYEPHDPRAYERHCEAWGVRGHYRHYKGGKTVYIHPHIKGRGRLKDTRYIFEA